MKILISGIGSIGRRHLKNLMQLGETDIILHRTSGQQLAEHTELPVFTSIEEALRQQPDLAIISQPTFLHIELATALVSASIPYLFIEKPLSHHWVGVQQLLSIVRENNIKTTIGFDLRFDPGFQQVYEWLQADVIGHIVSIHAEVGQYLPDWRPHEDYRQGMSASKKMGGGVMLDLVHEFDYLTALAGPVREVAAMYGRGSQLEIETEDTANILLHFDNGAMGTLRMDYLQKKLSRNCKIIGANGMIVWDYAGRTATVSTLDNGIAEQFDYNHFERNDRFVQEMKYLLECVEKGKDGYVNASKGAELLKLVLAAKHSFDTRTFVRIQHFEPPV
jgi:predicted dehydrogenase